jgi:hypothetical protein
MRLRRPHALVRPQLPGDLGVRVERLADVRLERRRRGAAREVGAAAIEVDQRALHFLLVRVLGKTVEREEEEQ